jgi:hypothetical protein
MGRCRMVEPERIRLPISDGDFIDVKRQLTAGEHRRIFLDQIKGGIIISGQELQLDPAKLGVTRILAYVVGWSLVDADGRPIPFSESTLLLQDADTYDEILAAVDAHIEAQERVRAERRANPTSASLSLAIS